MLIEKIENKINKINVY